MHKLHNILIKHKSKWFFLEIKKTIREEKICIFIYNKMVDIFYCDL